MDTDSCFQLTTAELRRHGLLLPREHIVTELTWLGTWQMAGDSVTVIAGPSASVTLQRGYEAQTVSLDATRQHYGGQRWWFKCPLCSRRCSTLYLYANHFECRTCHGLTYRIWRENGIQRHTRRAWKIQRKLDTPLDAPRSCWQIPAKPKGMHWKTYRRLTGQLAHLLVRLP